MSTTTSQLTAALAIVAALTAGQSSASASPRDGFGLGRIKQGLQSFATRVRNVAPQRTIARMTGSKATPATKSAARPAAAAAAQGKYTPQQKAFAKSIYKGFIRKGTAYAGLGMATMLGSIGLAATTGFMHSYLMTVGGIFLFGRGLATVEHAWSWKDRDPELFENTSSQPH